MNDFAAYSKECYGRETLEDSTGFVIYEDYDNCIYIHILYIKPEHRKKRAYIDLCHKAMGDKKYAICYVDMTQKHAERALSAFLVAGCKIDKELTNTNKDRIYLIYER